MNVQTFHFRNIITKKDGVDLLKRYMGGGQWVNWGWPQTEKYVTGGEGIQVLF
jgi:hypothetical protein